MQLNESQVTEFLRAEPQFFERNAALLADLYLPSPHGNGAISLAERQQLAQRDKIRILEAKLSELIQFGEENDAISDKLHRLTLGMLAARDLDALLQMVTHGLREDFQIPHVAVRLWKRPRGDAPAAGDAFAPVDPAVQSMTDSLLKPLCGPSSPLDIDPWFGERNAPLQSYALIALRGEQTLGLLALASEDAQRFYPKMGTLYLKRLGELLSVALLRHLL